MRHRGEGLAALAAVVAALLWVAPGAGAGFVTHEIEVDDPPGGDAFAFTPDRLSLDGNSSLVHWERGVDGDAKHGIRQPAGLFGLAPTLGEIDFDRQFSAGTFRYYCPIHGSPRRGMDGVVRVAPYPDLDPLGPPFDVVWAHEKDQDTGGRFDVRFRRQGASAWTIWKNDTVETEAEFGANDQPVFVRKGRTYEFQARSEKLNDPSKRSGWSPVLEVTP